MDEKNYIEITQSGGVINISEDVLGSIAYSAATGVADVASMASVAGDGVRGVVVCIGEEGCTMQIHINVRMGAVVSKTAADVQQAVKTAIESMTELNIVAVDVFVAGITVK